MSCNLSSLRLLNCSCCRSADSTRSFYLLNVAITDRCYPVVAFALENTHTIAYIGGVVPAATPSLYSHNYQEDIWPYLKGHL